MITDKIFPLFLVIGGDEEESRNVGEFLSEDEGDSELLLGRSCCRGQLISFSLKSEQRFFEDSSGSWSWTNGIGEGRSSISLSLSPRIAVMACSTSN